MEKLEINNIYSQVLKLVKIGLTIRSACDVANIAAYKFYKNINKEQKQELKFYKTTTRVSGYCSTRETITFED